MTGIDCVEYVATGNVAELFLFLLSSSLVCPVCLCHVNVSSIRSNSYFHWIMRVLRLTDCEWDINYEYFMNRNDFPCTWTWAEHGCIFFGRMQFLFHLAFTWPCYSYDAHVNTSTAYLSLVVGIDVHNTCCQSINEAKYVEVAFPCESVMWIRIYARSKRILLTDKSLGAMSFFFINKLWKSRENLIEISCIAQEERFKRTLTWQWIRIQVFRTDPIMFNFWCFYLW